MSFRVGVSRDLITASGGPCFNPAAFDELAANPAIEWEWMDEVKEVTQDQAAQYDGLLVALPRVTAATVARDDCRLKIVARNGVGYDTVDFKALAAKGILTTNTPFAIRRPVSVAALTLIFALTGKLFKKDALVRAGKWNERTDHMGVGLTTRTLGIVGCGGIGSELVKLAKPFFGRILVADPHVREAQISALGGSKVDLETLCREADVVNVCCLLNEETRGLIGPAEFALMKPTAFYVNVGRGPITNEAALIEALRQGRIAAAGLDVTDVEPIQSDNPLLGMENTIITAHALCWTDECFEEIARTALRSIVDVSEGRRPVHVVTE